MHSAHPRKDAVNSRAGLMHGGLPSSPFHSHKLSSHSLNPGPAHAAAQARSCCHQSPELPSKHVDQQAAVQRRPRQGFSQTVPKKGDGASGWLPAHTPGLISRPQMPTPEKLQQLRSRPDPQQQVPPSPPAQQPVRKTSANPKQKSSRTNSQNSDAKSRKRPLPTRVLGVDYGTSFTGLALGSPGNTRELQVLRVDRDNRGQFARDVVDIAVQHQVQGIVVGLPLDPYNPQSTLTNPRFDSRHATRCRWFSNTLAIVARPHDIDVYLYDESGTSTDALRVAGLKGRASLAGFRTSKERLDSKIDTLAALLLVQRFMSKPGAAVRVVIRDGATLDNQPPEAESDSGSTGGGTALS